MLLTEMTFDDQMILTQYRIERLHRFFADGLLRCVLCVDHYNILTIHCLELETVDSLLINLEDFCNNVWLILGAEAISICFLQEEILRIENHRFCTAIY